MICDQCETVKHCTKYGCIPERIGKPKPAAQRQPSWVGLTGQQKSLIARISVDVFDAIHRTEAKLKEKNT
jgi:hypothetical protein